MEMADCRSEKVAEVAYAQPLIGQGVRTSLADVKALESR